MKRFVGEAFRGGWGEGCKCYDSAGAEQIFANLNISRIPAYPEIYRLTVVGNVNTMGGGAGMKTLVPKKKYTYILYSYTRLYRC